MKNMILSSGMFLLVNVSQSFAQSAPSCGVGITPIPASDIISHTVCVGAGASPGDWEAQEYHAGSSGSPNNLIDFKKGSSDPVDPTGPVGTWTNSGDIFTYTYGGTSYLTVYCTGGSTGIYFVNNTGTTTPVHHKFLGQGSCG